MHIKRIHYFKVLSTIMNKHKMSEIRDWSLMPDRTQYVAYALWKRNFIDQNSCTNCTYQSHLQMVSRCMFPSGQLRRSKAPTGAQRRLHFSTSDRLDFPLGLDSELTYRICKRQKRYLCGERSVYLLVA